MRSSASKFFFYERSVPFTSYYSYGFCRRDVNKANVTFDIFVAALEVLLFRASKVAISALRLHGTNTFGRDF